MLPLLAGLEHNILCTWSGGNVAKMAWYLEGLDSIPLVSECNSSVVVLSPDPSTTGLHGTTFICRATTFWGDTFDESIILQVKGV